MSLAQNSFARADGIILVFDLSDRKSFDSLDYWLGQISQQEVILVGNKSDLEG